MKIDQLSGAARLWRPLALVTAVSLLGMPVAQAATTDIQVWYSLTAHNEKVFEKLVDQFNGHQSDVKVKLKAFTHPEDIPAALASAKGKSGPNLVQLIDDHSPADISKDRDIKPLYTLLAKYPIKNDKWFLSSTNAFAHDTKGRLVAFPYMADVPVVFYNIGAFKKAGIKPTQPSRSWHDLQGQLVTLTNKSTRKCPLTTDLPVSVNLENLASVNKQLFISDENGSKTKKNTPAFSFDLMYIRHLSMMISWVRAEIMVKPASAGQPVARFANNECAVLMSSSSNLGQFSDTRSLDFGITGLPYYPEVTKTPGNPFVGGAALWATTGHPAAEDKATSEFLDWLAQPDNAARWYQETGYLPLTKQAFADTDSSYYKKLGDWRSLVAVYASSQPATERGFWIKNYPKIKAMLKKTLNQSLDGQMPAVPALKTAEGQASSIMRER